MKDWQHSATDKRGPRTVTLDGKVVTQVVFADTKRGYILKHTGAVTRRGDLQLVKLRGKVEVTPC